MWMIVDGYNVMHAGKRKSASGRNKDFQKEREEFIQRLGAYRGQRQDKVTVVFDGAGGREDTLSVSKSAGVEIIYSRRGQTADEVIQQLVKDASSPGDIMVVSSDREIVHTVRTLGATVSSARALSDKLTEAEFVSELKRDGAAHFERHVKGYREEEDISPGKRRGSSRRAPRKRSVNRLWRSS